MDFSGGQYTGDPTGISVRNPIGDQLCCIRLWKPLYSLPLHSLHLPSSLSLLSLSHSHCIYVRMLDQLNWLKPLSGVNHLFDQVSASVVAIATVYMRVLLPESVTDEIRRNAAKEEDQGSITVSLLDEDKNSRKNVRVFKTMPSVGDTVSLLRSRWLTHTLVL